MRLLTLGVALGLLLSDTPALAVDGVLEISQACAVATGCFSGDVAGYPITIDGSAGRSYRLTSDLVVPDENTDGIRVNTSSISIDLNGFEIVRSGCEGALSNCAPPAGTGSGVTEVFGNAFGTSVRNGTITGMGWLGVRLGFQAEVRNLHVRWNRLSGIAFANGSLISDNTAFQNGNAGIEDISGDATIRNNTVYQNAGAGVLSWGHSTISGNTVTENGDDGIRVANFGSTISGNTVANNGDDGIQAPGSIIQGNTAQSNTGFGLRALDSGYRENTISGNVGGTVTGGVDLGANSCNATATCP